MTNTGLGLSCPGGVCNDGGTVDVDQSGKLVTAASGTPATNLFHALVAAGYPGTAIINTGSVLTIQQNGLAGPGTALNPLLVRVTAATHLDETSYPAGWANSREFQSGVIYLTAGTDGTVAGDGLGVRAFTVSEGTTNDPANAGNRTGSGTAYKIEGSKEVSGGTDCSTFGAKKDDCAGSPDYSGVNGAPHVDELAFFDFTAGSGAWDAKNFSWVLTDFTSLSGSSGDRYDIHIDWVGGNCTEKFLSSGAGTSGVSNTASGVLTGNSGFLTGGCAGIPAGAMLSDFYIRAVDDDPSNPRGTAEHFLINGFTVNPTEILPPEGGVPEPSTPLLFGAGLCALLVAARRRRNSFLSA